MPAGLEGNAGFVAVMYHYVRDRFDGPAARIRGLSRAALAEQLDELCRSLEPMRWEDALRSERLPQGALRRSFLLTFDDGLSDHFDVVAPVLEERGLRGVFFVPARAVAERRMLPAHQLHLLLAQLGAEALQTRVERWLRDRAPDCGDLAPAERVVAATTYGYEAPALAALKYRIHYALPVQLRNRMLDELFAAEFGEDSPWAERWYLTAAQAVELERRGHAVGGHGYSHDPLHRMTPARQRSDIERCAQWLDEVLGHKARPFSYPFGGFDKGVAKCCAELGFAGAFTTQPGWNEAEQLRYEFRRVDTIHLTAFLREEVPCLLS